MRATGVALALVGGLIATGCGGTDPHEVEVRLQSYVRNNDHGSQLSNVTCKTHGDGFRCSGDYHASPEQVAALVGDDPDATSGAALQSVQDQSSGPVAYDVKLDGTRIVASRAGQ